MSLKLITPAALFPVTTAEMKLQCGLGPMEDSDQLREQTLREQLTDAIQGATKYVEGELCRALITQTWQLTLDRFPRASGEYTRAHRHDIEIPIPKFQSLTGFTYIDETGTSQNMLASGAWGYQLIDGGDTQPARVRPPSLLPWPVTQIGLANAVSLTYSCGYGDTPSAIPASIRSAIKLVAQHLFEQRSGDFPPVVALLLADYINPV